MVLLRHITLSIFVQVICVSLMRADAAPQAWEKRFAQPSSDARILKIIHNWPDPPEAQDKLIERLQNQGLGGVVCNVSFDQYLESDAKWNSFTRAVTAAKQAGMAMWLYDERGYPSGNAGGLTLRGHPEWEACGLLVATGEWSDQAVQMELPPGKLVLAAAFPVRDGRIGLEDKVDLSARTREGKLNWRAPAGRWRVMAITENRLFEGTHADGNLHAKIPYVNLLMAEPTKCFIDLTYGGYARHLGNDLGKHFMATFTDEPSLMSLFLRPMPYSPLPWSPNLPAEFRKRRGYTLEAAMLPALVADAGSRGARIRHDFWLTVGELVSENYFGQIQARCRKLGIPSGGHLLAEEGMVGHVPLYGDFFRCIRRLDAPSIDCLTSLPPDVPWHIARLLASAGELENRTLVMSETSDHAQRYRPAGDRRPVRTVSEAEIRGTCNRLIVAGVNSITSYYSFADLSDEQLRRLNEWVGRCCTALRGGHQVADIAVLYPSESLWVAFTPSRHWTREASAAARIEASGRAAAECLFSSQRDFTFVDSRALAEAKIQSGAFVHGKLNWRVLILPGADTLPIAAWKNIERFVRSGGVVIALGALPENSEAEFPSPKVQAIARAIFGHPRTATSAGREPHSSVNSRGGAGIFLPRGLETLLPNVLDKLLGRDLRIAEPNSPIRFTHRRIENRDIYFVINDSAKAWSGRLEFASGTHPERPSKVTFICERWDPVTGQLAETTTSPVSQLNFEPYGAAVFRMTSANEPQRLRVSNNDALPQISLRPIPGTEPTCLKGDFVRATLTPGADSGSSQAHATITRSKVDTFLFAQFHYEQPLDLSLADCLAIETVVPDGQATPNQVLVIIHEEGGGDFIAETGRSLAAPGREQSFLAMNLFKLAGWSKDDDGILNPKKISDIRIGWGGYTGMEGENVRFSVFLPKVGSVLQP